MNLTQVKSAVNVEISITCYRLTLLFIIFFQEGDWHWRANAKESDAPSPSGLIVDTEMLKYLCWLASGRLPKTPYFKGAVG